MSKTTTHTAPTAREVVADKIANKKRALAQAKRQAAAKPTEPATGSTVPAVPAARPVTTAVTVRDDRPYQARYLDEVAPSGIAGRLIKFDKNGTFVTPDDDGEIDPDAKFVALCDQTLIGWIRFTGVGEPPDRHQGLLYDGWTMPMRESLGDVDPTQWDEGLDKQPADPWQHQICLVLQHAETSELFTFVTSSKTGRRAVGVLLRHFDRMQRTNPGDYPVVRLGKDGFEHRDTRIGFVNTPVFVVVGRHSRDSVATPDTSTAAYLDDDLPDNMK